MFQRDSVRKVLSSTEVSLALPCMSQSASFRKLEVATEAEGSGGVLEAGVLSLNFLTAQAC